MNSPQVSDDPLDDSTLASLGTEARRDAIVGFVGSFGPTRVETLADRFAVSKMTVHRDLDLLANEGRIVRVRGGARAVPAEILERDVSLRRISQAPQKRALAETAMTLVGDSDVIALDDSSTVGAMVDLFEPDSRIVVITHSLAVIKTIAVDFPDITLVGLGGQYYPETESFLGAFSSGVAATLRANTVFVSTTALRGGVLCHPDAEAATTKRALIGLAERKVLLVDSTKFTASGLYQVASLDEFDDVVIEADLAPEHREELARFPDLTIHEAPVR